MIVVTILKIRCIQLLRMLKEIGFIRDIVLLVFVAFLSMLVIQTIKQSSHSMIVSILAGLTVLSIHASRKDKHFIKINFKSGYFIFLVEYLTLLIPVLIVFIIYKDWINSLVLILSCILIPRIYLNLGLRNVSSTLKLLLNPFSSNFSYKVNITIPIVNPKAFEWISGLRRNFIILIPLYLLFLAFSFKQYIGPVAIFVMSVLVSGFYYIGESREFIELFSRNYRTFLLQKIKMNLMYLGIIFVPFVLVSLIFQPATWFILLGTIILAIMIQVITIIFKYALFAENADLGRNGIIIIINIICLLLPFLWPLPIIMGIRYYIKAQNNLKYYLDDNN